MADNPIDVIREAELEAEKILRDAAMESKRIEQDAKLEAARIEKDNECAAKAAAEQMIIVAREKSHLTLNNAEAALEQELQSLRLQAGDRQKQAVAAVIEALV